jgi:hypothetical protein
MVDPPISLLSDFEDPALAVITSYGGRNGVWYTYNDGSPGCTQTPAQGAPYLPTAPPAPSTGLSGGLALHAVWAGCTTWGAGVGADIAVPVVDGGSYTGPRVPYDVSAYGGILFFAMATPGSDNHVRFEVAMSASTSIADGGTCDEAVVGAGKCGDQYGHVFSLPVNGSWQPLTIRFADTASFKQEGWGAPFPWNPRDVVGVRIQSVDAGETYDFWLDDLYLTE